MPNNSLNLTSLAAKILIVTAVGISAASHAETCPASDEIRGPYPISPNVWMVETASGWRGFLSAQIDSKTSFRLATFQTPVTDEPGLPACIYDATYTAIWPAATTLGLIKPSGPALTLTIDTASPNKWRQSPGSDDYACDNNGDDSSGPLTQADCPFKPVSPPVSTASVNPFGKK